MAVIAVIGGTGPQGRGLSYRFAGAGHEVILGSRAADRASAAAQDLKERLHERSSEASGSVGGATNAEAAELGEVVLLAVPFEGHDDLVAELAPQLRGKLVISCVNPLAFDHRGPYGLDLGPTSAAENAQRLLPDSRVVGAFHHLSAVALSGAESLSHEDVLVCGDDPDAKETVIELAASVTGKPGIDAGALRLARHLEPLTAVLISVNKKYKVRSGVALTGLRRNEG
jgi:8-hydroxy-5-deazaflavin:NADPH oxidoreductase